MNINVNVQVELSAATLDALKTIFGGFSNPVSERNAAQAPIKELKKTEPTPLVTPPPAEVNTNTIAFTKEQVRAAAAEQSRDGKKDAVIALLKELGATKIGDLAEDRYGDFMAKLKTL